MEITTNNIMLVTASLLMISVFAGKTGRRYGIPALLLFLGVGMLAGVDGFGLQFDSAETTQFISMISLSVILFTGGFDTKLRDIRPVLAQGITLATVGVLITTGLTGVFIYYLFHLFAPDYAFDWCESLLLAAVISSTDSASVFSIFDSAKTGLKENLRPTLELESGSNDPMAYLLVIILIGIIQGTGEARSAGAILGSSALMLGIQLVSGAICGLALGYASVWLLNRLNTDNEFFYPVTMLSCVFFTVTITEYAGGNSYLAVYIAGLVLGNHRLAARRTIATFFGGFTWLVQIIMFLSLGLLVNPHELVDVAVPGLALGLFIIVIGRPCAVFLSLLPFRNYSFRGKCYISWVGLRGAVPIIFATYALVAPEVRHARFMFDVVFFVTIMSLLIQGMTVNRMAQWLGLALPVKEPAFAEVELPEELDAISREYEVSESSLVSGDRMRDMRLPAGTLAVMIRRGDRYIVPKGDTRLQVGDVLLLMDGEDPGRDDAQNRL